MNPVGTRTSRVCHAAALVLVTAAALARPAAAQGVDPVALEQRLPALSGVARVRALAQLCRAYRSTAPEKALAFGREALSLAESYPDPDAQARALNESAWALMELGRYDQAMAEARAGEALARSSSLRRGEARALNNEGVIERRRGSYADALERFHRSLALYQEIHDSAAVATSYNNLSVVQGFDLGDFEQALATQLQALRIRRRLGAPQPLYQSYNTLGVIYDDLGREDDATRYLNQALDGWRSLKVEPRIAATLSNLAGVYTKTGLLDRALALQQEAMTLREKLSNTSGVAASLENIGTILTRLGRLDEARTRLDSSLVIRRRLGERKNTASSLLALARLEQKAGHWERAEARIQEALGIASDVSARDTERQGYQQLASLREARGDARGALAAFHQWNRLDSALFNEAGARRVDALRAEYEADQAQGEIERLSSQAALESAAAERRGILLAVAVLLGVVLFLLYRRHVTARLRHQLEMQVQERTSALSDANERLRDLSLTDALTGLKNRRYVFQTVATDVALSMRAHGDAVRVGRVAENADLVFYLLDLDDFKTVNDEFGHASGDLVLQQMARLLERTARASDIVARWGGEEFLILGRQADRAGARAFAERLRESVAEHEFRCDDGRVVRRTCSVGFAAFPFVPSTPGAVSWEVVLGLADQAAYVAKRSGRDAWVGVAPSATTDPWLVSAAASVVQAMVEAGELTVDSSRVDRPSVTEWEVRGEDTPGVMRG